ncbi:splicing factor U2af large subunit B isoform X1 [Rhododendron vialii]|uniref:splicing factor U2af large subunit B isoform X1 n=1 Tax=Rhododendron vialii TaxID=182163 RepID=UPI00265EA0EC|nr:splicing factor U2af large subunit B isoform X1 [Rhododendron vialii]XP_058215946.1 splicing factor U2af large subunit B isoform X1 [Rhododendron vialii]
MSSIGEADCAASTQRTEVELMESDTMSEPVNELSDEEDEHHREYERKSSKSREKEREKGRDKERDRDRDRDRDRGRDMDMDKDKERHRERDRTRDRDRDRTRDRDRDEGRDRDRHRDRDRDHYGERSERRGRGRDRDDDDHHRSRDYERPKDYEGDREHRHSHRSKSRSSGRSEHRSRSRSKRALLVSVSGLYLQQKDKRFRYGTSRFCNISWCCSCSCCSVESSYQMAWCHFGQIPGTTPPAIPGMFPNMFPLPTGQQFGALPIMPVQAMTQQATRHARRVYVGGLPPSANEQSVATFFSHVMSAIGGNTAGPGDAVVNVYINHEKKFAFVEMRSVEEASNAMALDGIIFEGAPVKVRRPSDYNPSLAATLGPSQPNPNLNLGAVGLTPGSAGGLEGPDRIFVGGLPYYFTEVQIRELLESFGPLRGFDLVKDRETGNSKGYAFCVYQDLAVTDIACAALNGIKMGDKTLTVRRANQGTTQPKPEQENVLLHAQQQIALQRLMLQPTALATKVLCLTQVVNVDELKDDEDYEDIIEDMRTECGKFGTLVNVVIPRPNPNGEPTPGLGKVFLEYVDVDGATKARQGLNGRKFGGNQVVAVFYPENKFAEADYDG